MKYEKDEYVISGVGNYQFYFDNFILPFNKMQEDKIIHTDKKNFLVLRHATIDFDSVEKIFRRFNNTVKQINMNHIGYMIPGSNKKLVSSRINNAKLKYIAIENECDGASAYKIVLEFDDIEFARKIEDIRR